MEIIVIHTHSLTGQRNERARGIRTVKPSLNDVFFSDTSFEFDHEERLLIDLFRFVIFLNIKFRVNIFEYVSLRVVKQRRNRLTIDGRFTVQNTKILISEIFWNGSCLSSPSISEIRSAS